MPRIVLPGVYDPQTWRSPYLLNSLIQFDRVLRTECSIELAAGRSVSDAINHLLDLISAFDRETPENPHFDLRPGSRVAVGLSDLAQKAVHVTDHPDFRQLCPHFALLLEESALLQNLRSDVTDAASNKLFELMIALSVMQFGRDVRLDHPDVSRGDNPDVLALVRGAEWGFACKVPHTRQLRTYAGNVITAVDQIERSPAQHGLVLMNLKNLVDHDIMWPIVEQPDGTYLYKAWPDSDTADAALEAYVGELLGDWEEAFGGDDGVREIFDGKKAAPIVLNYVHLTVLVLRNERPVLTSLRRIVPLALGFRHDAHADPVIEMLHNAVQRP